MRTVGNVESNSWPTVRQQLGSEVPRRRFCEGGVTRFQPRRAPDPRPPCVCLPCLGRGLRLPVARCRLPVGTLSARCRMPVGCLSHAVAHWPPVCCLSVTVRGLSREGESVSVARWRCLSARCLSARLALPALPALPAAECHCDHCRTLASLSGPSAGILSRCLSCPLPVALPVGGHRKGPSIAAGACPVRCLFGVSQSRLPARHPYQ